MHAQKTPKSEILYSVLPFSLTHIRCDCDTSIAAVLWQAILTAQWQKQNKTLKRKKLLKMFEYFTELSIANPL